MELVVVMSSSRTKNTYWLFVVAVVLDSVA